MTLLWVACAVFIAVAPYAWVILDARRHRAKLIEPRHWTEAQMFEPVSKWVEDAERAMFSADGFMVDGEYCAGSKREDQP